MRRATPTATGALCSIAEQRDRLVGRGGLTEKVDKQPALAGILVGQKRQGAVLLEHFDHLIEAASLGNQAIGRSARGSARR